MRLTITGKPIWEDNPILKRRKALHIPPEGRTEKQLDEIVRFVHFLVDPDDSPVSQERDFEYRRHRANELAKMRKNDIGEAALMFGEKHNDITEWICQVMTEYLRMVNATLFETWFTMKMNYFQTTNELRKPVGQDKDGNSEKVIKDRAAIAAGLPAMGQAIQDVEQILFSGIQEISNMATEATIEKSLAGYAELNAETLEDDMERMYSKN